jgi:hypothetical protein
MSDARFLHLPLATLQDGSWLDHARAAWLRGDVGLILVEPQPTDDGELRTAIATMLESNGSYRPGDRAVIHARPAALEMGCETAMQLRARGIEATVVSKEVSSGPDHR